MCRPSVGNGMSDQLVGTRPPAAHVSRGLAPPGVWARAKLERQQWEGARGAPGGLSMLLTREAALAAAGKHLKVLPSFLTAPIQGHDPVCRRTGRVCCVPQAPCPTQCGPGSVSPR